MEFAGIVPMLMLAALFAMAFLLFDLRLIEKKRLVRQKKIDSDISGVVALLRRSLQTGEQSVRERQRTNLLLNDIYKREAELFQVLNGMPHEEASAEFAAPAPLFDLNPKTAEASAVISPEPVPVRDSEEYAQGLKEDFDAPKMSFAGQCLGATTRMMKIVRGKLINAIPLEKSAPDVERLSKMLDVED